VLNHFLSGYQDTLSGTFTVSGTADAAFSLTNAAISGLASTSLDNILHTLTLNLNTNGATLGSHN